MRTFELQSNERIIRVFRQNKLILLQPGIIALAIILIPAYYVWHYSLTNFNLGAVFFALVGLGYYFREYRLWALQKYIITTHRLLKQYHESLFKKIVLETPLERILNISFKTTGLFSVLFRYGDVEVQVVGLIEPIILKNITQPERIKEYLWRAHEEAMKKSVNKDIVHLQERDGYTKENQRVL